uniref:Activin types I and II receptor domain-containing protein n=1 Tax=Ascaris lumbricoides TaxID=6252 RepID=A0A9J2Q185_ASCLU
MGYCGDICPAIFHSHHCIYQDVGENFPLLRQMIGTSSAIAVCCCENDLCNGVENLSIIKFQQLLLITLNFILLNLFQFIFYSL